MIRHVYPCWTVIEGHVSSSVGLCESLLAYSLPTTFEYLSASHVRCMCRTIIWCEHADSQRGMSSQSDCAHCVTLSHILNKLCVCECVHGQRCATGPDTAPISQLS